MIKNKKMGIITKERKSRRREMKTETRKRANLISAKLLQKHNNSDKRNNINSTSCNYSCSFNISRNNNKLSIQ